ncbi:MAG: hypothetical protein HOP11_11230 [Saprospiraceae bacterium]|nr:hypothetical protein [Saprospiraceae bacterium]
MRLLGNIAHPKLNISVFKSSEKIIVKFEAGPLEQSYKFLENELIYSVDSVEKLLTEEVYKKVFEVFDKMYENYKEIHI